MTKTNTRVVTVRRSDSYKLSQALKKPSSHDSAGVDQGAHNKPRALMNFTDNTVPLSTDAPGQQPQASAAETSFGQLALAATGAKLPLQVCSSRAGFYLGTRDTTSRLKALLEAEGFKVAVLRASVEAAKREDWLLEQVDRNVDVVITNPELVKTGLDMLEFPTIVFMQSGYNVYTLQQASRRSWRIGQKQHVDVHFLGYEG